MQLAPITIPDTRMAAPTHALVARELLDDFAGRDAPSIDLHRLRARAEFADEFASRLEIIDPRSATHLPAVTRMLHTSISPGPLLRQRVEFRSRAGLFEAMDQAAAGVVTLAQAEAFLRSFDSTPGDGVFEPAQLDRLQEAFPEQLVTSGFIRMNW